MNKVIQILLALFLSTLLVPATQASSNHQLEFDNYVVHYNVVPSRFLQPQVARSIGIKRSHSRGVVTISVLQKIPGQPTKAVQASITGTTCNLFGRDRKLKLKEIFENGQVSYIAEVPIVRKERLKINFSVQPQGATRSHSFEFVETLLR